MADDHVRINRDSWDEDAPNWVDKGRRAWATEEPVWGRGNRESDVSVLPDVSGLDTVEIGCGTAYVSAWLVRRGANAVAMDNSRNQLATARILQGEFDLRFPLVHADGERPPFSEGSFDFAISQYGAATFCDPSDGSRGGRLVFENASPLVQLCYPSDVRDAPADSSLHRDYFGMHRFVWRESDGSISDIDFHIGHGDMVRLFGDAASRSKPLIELQAPTEADEEWSHIPLAWARRWPSAEIWQARKTR